MSWHIKKKFIVSTRTVIFISGNRYEDLGYLFHVAPNTLSGLIPETCAAIYDALQETYLKVSQDT